MTTLVKPPTTTAPIPQTARNLLHAVDYIRTYGWCQGHFVAINDMVCAVGAIHAVHYGQPAADVDCTDWEKLPEVRAVARHLGIAPEAVPEWNDEIDRTEDEVVGVLLAAALIEAAQA